MKDFFKVPIDVYPIGRLDYDSEGLLILTNDKQLNHQLLNPKHKHEREYFVQVEGEITNEALQKLSHGVDINIDGKKYHTLPAKAAILNDVSHLPERNPPIRFRINVPTSWISLSLVEGKNRQVRRMTASVGFPTLRLIRYRIEKLKLEGLHPGDMKEMTKQDIYQLLKLKSPG